MDRVNSLGIKAPHCRTSHVDWMETIQNATITAIMARVNNGRRNTYERALRVLKPWMVGIIAVCGRTELTVVTLGVAILPLLTEALDD